MINSRQGLIVRFLTAAIVASTVVLLWNPAPSRAATNAGTLDTSFDPGSGTDGTVEAIAVQPDGKLIIAGNFNTVNGQVRHNIARLTADGQVDQTFDPGAGPDNTVNAVAIRSDGTIMIGGEFHTCDGQMRLAVARLDASGRLDTGFNPVIGVTGSVRSVATQPDGKTIIAGNFSRYDNVATGNITRIDSQGHVDPSFQAAAGADRPVSAVSLQPDGKILIGGEFASYDGVARQRIARLNADGTLDTGYGSSGAGADGVVSAVAALPDGGALIGGSFASVDGSTRHGAARLDSGGAVDALFDPGVGPDGPVLALAMQSDRKIMVVGQFDSFAGKPTGGVSRLMPDGTVDASFNNGQPGATGAVRALATFANATALLGGSFATYDGQAVGGIARLKRNGTPSITFGAGPGTDGPVRAVAAAAAGTTLIAGDFTSYDGMDSAEVARLQPNGKPDGSFDIGAGSNGNIYAIAAQTDGKIVVGGNFTAFNHAAAGGIARLNPDGSQDTTFDRGGAGTNGYVYAVVPLSGGKTLIGGAFNTYDGHGTGGLARLNPDGTLDESFNAGGAGGVDFTVNAIALQPDGEILIGGWFYHYNKSARSNIARLHADGTLDSFNPGLSSDNSVLAIAVQPNGQILIGGEVTHYGSTSAELAHRLAGSRLGLGAGDRVHDAETNTGWLQRFNADGSTDPSFNPSGTGPNRSIHSIAALADGRILIGGNFTGFNARYAGGVARLNAAGSVDSGFNNGGMGADDNVDAIMVQPDGKILIAGGFATYDGIPRQGIARLDG